MGIEGTEDTQAAAGDSLALAATQFARADVDDTLSGDRPHDVTHAVDLSGAPELTRGAVVGRHVVLARLGAGGMGVVYAAHDPELDRKIALKLVHPGARGDGGHTRMLREAQALARLSHPNVVSVHDVGTVGAQVWIAMEFVSGRTLTAWARERPRRWPEVLQVMRDVARGVAAAHAAGLVHRDLKPDNVMIGADGRVRVMDFGLAHGRHRPAAAPPRSRPPLPVGAAALDLQLTLDGAVQGTPAYMAPEQWQGDEAAATADQFAWSVTTWELLFGERPFVGESLPMLARAVCAGERRAPPRGRRVPAWLRRVVERGLAVRPAQRWPSMDALLAALDQGRARARARVVGFTGLGVAAALVGGALLHRRDAAQRIAACEATATELDPLWGPEPRARLQSSLRALDLPGAAAAADHVVPWLDRHAEAWRTARVASCVAQLERRWSADLEGRALWCLGERRVELAELLRTLAAPGAQAIHEAVPAAAGLRDPTSCLDEASLRRQPAPPVREQEAVREVQAALSRAGAEALAGAHVDALARATAARLRADALGWPPLRAAARLREGTLSNTSGDYPAAEQSLRAAYLAGARADAWDIAADAADALIVVVGYRLARHAEAPLWSDLAALAIERAGDPGGLRELDRIEGVAVVDLSRGDYPAARAGLERALTLRGEALGEDHPRYATTLNRLAAIAINTGDYGSAQALLERARAIRERVLGPDHPQLAAVLNNLGSVATKRGEHAAAIPLLTRALTIEERALGPDHPNIALDLHNLASAYNLDDHPAEALPRLERALAIQERALGPDHPLVATTLGSLASVKRELGDLAAARPLLERALEIEENTLGPDHPDLANSLRELGVLSLKTGNFTAATAALERAAGIHERTSGPDHPELAITLVNLADVSLAQRRPDEARLRLERARTIFDATPGAQLGEADCHFLLAKALLAGPGDRPRAAAEARRARELSAPKDRLEIDAWLAEHGL